VTYLEALFCFVLIYAALWVLWYPFLGVSSEKPSQQQTGAKAENIRQEMRTLEPPLYTRRTWKN